MVMWPIIEMWASVAFAGLFLVNGRILVDVAALAGAGLEQAGGRLQIRKAEKQTVVTALDVTGSGSTDVSAAYVEAEVQAIADKLIVVISAFNALLAAFEQVEHLEQAEA